MLGGTPFAHTGYVNDDNGLPPTRERFVGMEETAPRGAARRSRDPRTPKQESNAVHIYAGSKEAAHEVDRVSRTWLKSFPGVFSDLFNEQKRAAAFVLQFGRSIDMLTFEADGLVGLSVSELLWPLSSTEYMGSRRNSMLLEQRCFDPLSRGLK